MMPDARNELLLLLSLEQTEPVDLRIAIAFCLLHDDLRLSAGIGRDGDHVQEKRAAGFLADTELAAFRVEQQVVGRLTTFQRQFDGLIM